MARELIRQRFVFVAVKQRGHDQDRHQEIDAGIGGQTAFEVGRKLKSVAAYNQVICITHLPQVASFADHHLSVRKVASGKRTLTEVVELKTTERKQELARMLGGVKITDTTRRHAAEMLGVKR